MEEKKERGRPTKYKEEYNDQAYKLCLLGCTDEELAAFFVCHVDTIYEWQSVYQGFSESVKKGKIIADGSVAKSLYERATGFEKANCEEVFQYQGGIVRTSVTKYFPPDAGAALNWLKNRQKDKWRDKHEVEVSGEVKQVFKIGDQEIEL